MNTSDTKNKILDTAERLFARQGIGATSLRAIVREAGLNVAAIHYHFGSREALVLEVFNRRLKPINQQRVARLEEMEQTRSPAIPLNDLVRAFLEPVFSYFYDQPPQVRGLMARLHTEPDVTRPVLQQYHEILQRFQGAFLNAAPWLTPEQVRYRMSFMIGSMGIMLSGRHPAFCGKNGARLKPEQLFEEVIQYNTAGLSAGAPKK